MNIKNNFNDTYQQIDDNIHYDKKTKQLYWDIAIGLNEVDHLKPSSYFLSLVDEDVKNGMDKQQFYKAVADYYREKIERHEMNAQEYECDMVSIRINELLKDKSFTFSPVQLKFIHKFLFQDVYDFAGQYRIYNITKDEPILNGASVNYANYFLIQDTLDYDFREEKNKNYSQLSISEQIENFARFTSSIWQVHPFGEGNTRTTAVFMQKYLMAKGYNTNNEIFKSNSLYFRNALVRSNYENAAKRVFVNFDYLITFYRNLILGENIEMHARELIAYELFEKQEDTKK